MWRTFSLTTLLSVALCAQTNSPDQQGWRKFGAPAASQGAPAGSQEEAETYIMPPPHLQIPAGTWITVHVNEPLSSDHNQPGDAFTATLSQPLVANGFVIARRGQTVAGRVAEAQKHGKGNSSSRLGVELTEISLVDGQQVQLHTQLVQRTGPSSTGRDVAAVATTTGVGAAIGAAADGGFGAGVGAVAGAAAGVIGVIVTGGRPTEIYPEMALTFRTTQPMAVSTERAQQAFEPVSQQDFDQQRLQQRTGPPQGPPPAYYSSYPYPYYAPYYYGPAYYGPSWYGSSFYFYSRPGYGYYRGGRYRR
jgi:hypothetical protein